MGLQARGRKQRVPAVVLRGHMDVDARTSHRKFTQRVFIPRESLLLS